MRSSTAGAPEESYKYPLPASVGKKMLHPKLRQTKAKINAYNKVRKGTTRTSPKQSTLFVEGGSSPTPGLEGRQYSDGTNAQSKGEDHQEVFVDCLDLTGKMNLGRDSQNSRYSKESGSVEKTGNTYKYSMYNKRASNDIDGIASPGSPCTVLMKSTIHPSSPRGELANL